MIRRSLPVSLACAALASLTACTAVHPAAAHRSPAPVVTGSPADCPASLPAAQATTGRATGTAPVKQRPITAVICQYALQADGSATTLTGKVTFKGAQADGLAAIIAGAPPVPGTRHGCTEQAPAASGSVIIRFGYSSGQVIAAAIAAAWCGSPGAVTVGGQPFALPATVSGALLADATSTAGNSGPPVPDLIGLSMQAAETAAAAQGMTVLFDGAMADARAPLGSVIFQALPPGAPAHRKHGSQVRVIVAVRSAPACMPRQLRVAYRGNGAGKGSDFGAIVFRDIGSTPCTLASPARLTGLGPSGHPVTRTLIAEPAAPMVLTPRAAVIREGTAAVRGLLPPPAGLTGAIELGARYLRAANSLAGSTCTSQWVTPATWHVSFYSGLSFKVANADQKAPKPVLPTGAFVTCQGRISVITETYYGQPWK